VPKLNLCMQHYHEWLNRFFFPAAPLLVLHKAPTQSAPGPTYEPDVCFRRLIMGHPRSLSQLSNPAPTLDARLVRDRARRRVPLLQPLLQRMPRAHHVSVLRKGAGWNTRVDWAQSCEDSMRSMQGLGLRVVMQALEEQLDRIAKEDSGMAGSEARAEGEGEGEVEAFLSCVDPAHMTFEEQMVQAYTTTTCVSMHGTLGYLTLFQRDGTSAILVGRPPLKEPHVMLHLTSIHVLYLTLDQVPHRYADALRASMNLVARTFGFRQLVWSPPTHADAVPRNGGREGDREGEIGGGADMHSREGGSLKDAMDSVSQSQGGEQGPDVVVFYYRDPSWLKYYNVSQNFVDHLGLVVVEKIVGHRVVSMGAACPKPAQQAKGAWPSPHTVHLHTVGSIVHCANATDVIWGSGMRSADVLDVMAERKGQFEEVTCAAIRGPRSRQGLERYRCNCPEVYGDPGLLFPYLFPEFQRPAKPKRKFLIVMHFTELPLWDVFEDQVIVNSDPYDEVIRYRPISCFSTTWAFGLKPRIRSTSNHTRLRSLLMHA
jgi:hypothetical protein